MSVQMEQHERWVEARARLFGRRMPPIARQAIIEPPPAMKSHPVAQVATKPILARQVLPRPWPPQPDAVFYDICDPVDFGPKRWITILGEVAHKHGLTVPAITSRSRLTPLIEARFEAIFRMATETNMSMSAIGRRVGDRDHATVLHSIKQHLRRTPGSLPIWQASKARKLEQKRMMHAQVFRLQAEGKSISQITDLVSASDSTVRNILGSGP